MKPSALSYQYVCSEGDHTLEFQYGYDNQRRKTTLYDQNGIAMEKYFVGLYEKEIEGNTTRHINYITAGIMLSLFSQDLLMLIYIITHKEKMIMNLSRKIFIVLFVLTSLVVLSSCDPSMNLSLYIQNNSTEKIIVEFEQRYPHNNDTIITLNTGTEGTILNFSKREKAKCYDCCPCEIGSLNIFTVDSSATSMKNYENKDNWIKVIENKNVNCTLVINDEDLE